MNEKLFCPEACSADAPNQDNIVAPYTTVSTIVVHSMRQYAQQ